MARRARDRGRVDQTVEVERDPDQRGVDSPGSRDHGATVKEVVDAILSFLAEGAERGGLSFANSFIREGNGFPSPGSSPGGTGE